MFMNIGHIDCHYVSCRWINCLITAIQKHKKFQPDSEEGEAVLPVFLLKNVHLIFFFCTNVLRIYLH